MEVSLDSVLVAIFSGRPMSRIRIKPGAPPIRIVSARDVGVVLAPAGALETIEAAPDRSLDSARLEAGDVLVTARGTVRAAVALPEHEGAIAGPNLIVLRPKAEMPGAVIAAYLRLPGVQRRLQAGAYGTATVHFGVDDLKGLTMTVPPQVELQRLAEAVTLTDLYVETSNRAAAARCQIALEQVRQALETTEASR